METPEFLLWSLGFRCPVRGTEDGSDPERTERQLRAARAVSDARREGRVVGGLCLAPPLGFKIEDALAIYGGLAAVERACGGCPANVVEQGRQSPAFPPLAGCYAYLPLPHDSADFYAALDAALQRAKPLFPQTTPRWYGLWMTSPLSHEQAEVLADAFHRFATDGQRVGWLGSSEASPQAIGAGLPRDLSQGFDLLATGLRIAAERMLPLHAMLCPAGRIEGPWWRLVPHCPACRAAWTGPQPGRCAVCGYRGHPAPDKKRRVRGTRPYFPLDRLLGEEEAARVLATAGLQAK